MPVVPIPSALAFTAAVDSVVATKFQCRCFQKNLANRKSCFPNCLASWTDRIARTMSDPAWYCRYLSSACASWFFLFPDFACGYLCCFGQWLIELKTFLRNLRTGCLIGRSGIRFELNLRSAPPRTNSPAAARKYGEDLT